MRRSLKQAKRIVVLHKALYCRIYETCRIVYCVKSFVLRSALADE